MAIILVALSLQLFVGKTTKKAKPTADKFMQCELKFDSALLLMDYNEDLERIFTDEGKFYYL